MISSFCGAESVPWCFLGYNHFFGHRHIKLSSSSGIAIAYLIREIRSGPCNMLCCIPGFDNCDLELIVALSIVTFHVSTY